MAKSNEQKVVDAFVNCGNSHSFIPGHFAMLMAEQDHHTQVAFYNAIESYLRYKEVQNKVRAI